MGVAGADRGGEKSIGAGGPDAGALARADSGLMAVLAALVAAAPDRQASHSAGQAPGGW